MHYCISKPLMCKFGREISNFKLPKQAFSSVPRWEYSEAEYLARPMFLSVFLSSNGNTSTWSVTTTSQPRSAIPVHQSHHLSVPGNPGSWSIRQLSPICIDMYSSSYAILQRSGQPSPDKPQPAPSSTTRLFWSLALLNSPFLLFFSCGHLTNKTLVSVWIHLHEEN